jgi:hypothetical protein
MPNWAALHEDDRVVAILSRDSGREAKNELRLRTSDNLFEAMRGEMMTFINDQMSILRNTIIDDALSHETLDHSDINFSCRLAAPASDPADVTATHVQEG